MLRTLTAIALAALSLTTSATTPAGAQTCVRNALRITTTSATSLPRAQKRGMRRAERKWKRQAKGLYGCQFARLSTARIIYHGCAGKFCTVHATPCSAEGYICR